MRIQPVATVEFSEGIDGRNPNYYIKEKQQACEKCCVFFDWSKKAKIKVTRSIVWI